MASVFSKIIAGEFPGRFVWDDPEVVAFLTIAPLRPGHTLVVPREEVDHWPSLDPALMAHLTGVAQSVGQAAQRAYDAPRAGLIIAGFEVPHVHLHVFPAWDMADLDFAGVDHEPSAESLDDAAARLRLALRELGHGDLVPAP